MLLGPRFEPFNFSARGKCCHPSTNTLLAPPSTSLHVLSPRPDRTVICLSSVTAFTPSLSCPSREPARCYVAAALRLSESDEGSHVDPDGQNRIGVAMHVDGQGEFDVAGVLAVDASGEHRFHDGVQVHKGNVDRETRHLWRKLRKRGQLQGKPTPAENTARRISAGKPDHVDARNLFTQYISTNEIPRIPPKKQQSCHTHPINTVYSLTK